MLGHLAIVILATAGLGTGPTPVAQVGPFTVTAADMRTRLGQARAPSLDVRQAVRAEVSTRALALEAPAVLGERALKLDVQERADALLAHLFNPARVCLRIPEAAMRQRYTDTRWRFVAPPAWRVDDVQLLCCTNPKRCDQAAVLACITARGPQAEALRGELGRVDSADGLRKRVKALHAEGWPVQTLQYTFYHDPDNPGGEMDWRLQEVDLPIAEATAALNPGEISAVVTTRFGHHILRLDHTLQAISLSYEDPRTQAILRTELCPEHLLQQRGRYVTDLVAQAPVTYHQDALSALVLSTPPQAEPEARSAP